MRLIDADEVRAKLYVPLTRIVDAAPTVDVPLPLTRDGVLAEVKAIEDAGGKAVVEVLSPYANDWDAEEIEWVWRWHPEVRRYDVRVRAVEVETEDVPLTQLVGRTIKGETEAVKRRMVNRDGVDLWSPSDAINWRKFPDGTLDLATARVTVLKGEA